MCFIPSESERNHALALPSSYGVCGPDSQGPASFTWHPCAACLGEREEEAEERQGRKRHPVCRARGVPWYDSCNSFQNASFVVFARQEKVMTIFLLLRWLIEPFLVLLGGTAALLRRPISRPSKTLYLLGEVGFSSPTEIAGVLCNGVPLVFVPGRSETRMFWAARVWGSHSAL